MQPMGMTATTTWCFNCVKFIWHYKGHVNHVNHDAATTVVVIHLFIHSLIECNPFIHFSH